MKKNTTKKHCSVSGCDNPYRSTGYCGLHLARIRRHGTTDLPDKEEWKKNLKIAREKNLSEVAKLDREKFPNTYISGKAWRAVWQIKKDAARTMNLTDIQIYNFMIQECYYCGIQSEWPAGRNGIDRIDSNKDYSVDNCVSCCIICNRAKSDKTVEEFMEWVQRIATKNFNLKKDTK
jgi:hypothetical protein